TLPFAFRSYNRLRREAERMHDDDDNSDAPPGGDDTAVASESEDADGDEDRQAKAPHLRSV
ncbi:MAG: hypothetical protein AAF942_18245, partial [Pseudomonadota bacterium]